LASSVRPVLRSDLSPMTHMYLHADTSGTEAIKVGDIVEVATATQKVKLLEDVSASGGSKFVGIANSAWDPNANDAQLKTEIEIIGVAIVEVPVVSGSYTVGEALQYDDVADNGTWASWENGNQKVGWVHSCKTGTITSLKAMVDIYQQASGFLESSS